jgi:hypothetical protein
MPIREETCPICRDTGWVVSDETGASLARRCACFEKRRVPELIKRSNIPKRYRNCSFENFKPEDKSQIAALKLSKQFVEQFPGGRSAGLLFIGKCDGEKDAGAHHIFWDAKNYPSGTYFCRLQAGNFVETKKLLLLK